MMNNPTKVIFFSLFLTSLVLGSDERINALGGNAGFWPDDDQNINIFPATLNNFQLAQVSGVKNGAEKAVFLFGDKTKYGFVLDGDESQLINMMWGNGKMGVQLAFDNSSNDNGTDKTGTSAISAAFGQDMGFAELGVGFVTESDDSGTKDAGDDKSDMTIGVNLRRAQSLWVFEGLLLGFDMVTGTNGDATSSQMALGLDLYNHWDIGDGTDLLFALGFGFETETTNSGQTGAKDNVMTNILLPKYTLGVETNITDWAVARAGVTNNHALSSSNDDGTTATSTGGTAEFDAVFGIGFNYGGFTLDMELDPGFYTDPVSHITGHNGSSLGSGKATITYNW